MSVTRPGWMGLNEGEEPRRGRWKLTLPERFWSKVDKDHPSGCWVWTGQTDRSGYGVLNVGQRMEFAHRLAWVLGGRPIPTGHGVLHRCDNPPCVLHLFTGTQAENMADMAAKGRSTRGARSASARLAPEQVAEVRRRYAAGGISQAALASEVGVAQTTIGFIVRGVTWKETANAS